MEGLQNELCEQRQLRNAPSTGKLLRVLGQRCAAEVTLQPSNIKRIFVYIWCRGTA